MLDQQLSRIVLGRVLNLIIVIKDTENLQNFICVE